jgi:hypothetical protein
VFHVDSWPAARSDEAKVPSLALSDSTGKPIAFGSECLTPVMKRRFKKEQLYLAKHWKLHLHLLSMRFDPEATLVTPLIDIKLDEKNEGDMEEKGSAYKEDEDSQETIVPELGPPALPLKVTAERLYRLLLAYLFEHTKESFTKQMGGSSKLWKKLIPTAEIVMAIPDGWEDEQQAILRRAFVSAKILDEKGAQERLEFLREAEATVHATLKSGEAHDWLKVSSRVSERRRRS